MVTNWAILNHRRKLHLLDDKMSNLKVGIRIVPRTGESGDRLFLGR